jgi:uncharacterized integral membrane protein (TIGR00697 family)
MNTVLIFVEIVAVFAALSLCYRLFGKVGAIAWVAMATILANVITAKNANIFGLSTAIGTVMFASTFLATDILAEYHSLKDAKTAVYVGLFADVILIISTQIALLYQPSEFDYADGAMQTLFALNLRISLASMVMYFISNIADVYLFSKIKEKSNGKKLWLRNNVSTILCNCLENFGFIFLAFVGIYDGETILTIAVSTSIIEAIVAVCDTPFLYLAGAIHKRSGYRLERELTGA